MYGYYRCYNIARAYCNRTPREGEPEEVLGTPSTRRKASGAHIVSPSEIELAEKEVGEGKGGKLEERACALGITQAGRVLLPLPAGLLE